MWYPPEKRSVGRDLGPVGVLLGTQSTSSKATWRTIHITGGARSSQVDKPRYDSVVVTLTKGERYRRARVWLIWCVGCGVFGAIFPFETGLKALGFIGAASCAVAAIFVVRETTAWQLTDKGKLQKEAARRAMGLAVEVTFRGLIILAAVICGMYWLYVPVGDAFAGRVTVYEETCTLSDCEKPVVGNPLTFIVHVDQQLVIYTTDSAPAPLKLHNCVVADRTTWDCTVLTPLDSPHLTMKDGSYTDPNRLDNVRTVSRAKWIYDRFFR
jgi:hypothetical protein